MGKYVFIRIKTLSLYFISAHKMQYFPTIQGFSGALAIMVQNEYIHTTQTKFCIKTARRIMSILFFG
jgi:hypothetical protein